MNLPITTGDYVMYNLTLDRRKQERRYVQSASNKGRSSLCRRSIERRCDKRPLTEFPYLPEVISY
ncbi:hypothetical protein [Alkalimarinus alittae]|uniref:Uncharacterized protein n=1 Tax=Alkalimarinus alittae TaxID=2961619 RepID=A0ABY6N778_9ALTE|nr:hypothetical protein [Alkalimarinus alittae]UZE97869.1 hypothetical protein NKI27_09085 [Alkalimarinus alittae]